MSDKIDFHFISNCCPISKFIQESRNQALNLCLDQSYIDSWTIY